MTERGGAPVARRRHPDPRAVSRARTARANAPPDLALKGVSFPDSRIELHS